MTAEEYVPTWMLELVAAVDIYEYVHPSVATGEKCLSEALARVPQHVLDMARGYHRGKETYKGEQS